MQSLLQTLVNLSPADGPPLYEHSYLANLNSEYLSFERLAFYQSEKFFSFKCPLPSILDYFTFVDFDSAYEHQQDQYFSNAKVIKRHSTLLNLEKMLGYLLQSFSANGNQAPMGKVYGDSEGGAQQSYGASYSGSSQPRSQYGQHDFREIVSFNMHLKSKPVVGVLFLLAFIVILYRVQKSSTVHKNSLPKVMSFFWFFQTISLYLDLNLLSLETKPYSKILIQGLTMIDQTVLFLPEILHLLLFIITLFYFFCLVFRFHDIFGQDDVEILVQQINQIQQIQREQRRDQNQPLTNDQRQQQQQAQQPQAQDDIGNFSQIGLFSIEPLSIWSALEFYHCVVLHTLLFLTFAKFMMQCRGILFIRVTNFCINILDNLETFPFSPRLLSLFTISYFSYSQFKGKSNFDKTQYALQKMIPFFIVLIHSTILILKRQYIFTIDDVFCLVMFIMSLSLYLTYESPSAASNNRYPYPFLRSEAMKKKSEELLKQMLKESAQNMMNLTNIDAIRLSQEDIQRRQELIDETLRKSQEGHEEYMKKKKMIQERKFQSYKDNNLREIEYEDELGEEESEDNEIDFSQDHIHATAEEKKDSKNIFVGYNKEAAAKVAQFKLQEMLLQQLNQLSQMNEEARKIFQLGGGIDFSNDQEILQKLGLISSPAKAGGSSMEQCQPSPVQLQNQATQGGQGQQSNAKQTARKAPTKAPSGRPNQRKRR